MQLSHSLQFEIFHFAGCACVYVCVRFKYLLGSLSLKAIIFWNFITFLEWIFVLIDADQNTARYLKDFSVPPLIYSLN